jgi:alkylation response protein AidB-like acyl-CoA dehydrogenase
MAIGITDEHEALRAAVRRFVDTNIGPKVVRAEIDATEKAHPDFWPALIEPGWLGLHLTEANGGPGFSAVEQAIVCEELGRACAPGAYVPTAVAAATLQDAGGPATSLLAEVATGERTMALTLPGVGTAWGGHLVDTLLCHTKDGWAAFDADTVTVTQLDTTDITRPVARIDFDGVPIADERRFGPVEPVRAKIAASVLYAAEAVGVAQWCVETASEYAKVRVQFGRPIGQFQGVKHRCAEMLARTELARAAVWDAARALGDPPDDKGAELAIIAGAALAFDAAFINAKDCVQILGGIGFTWEHDAHLYLRRAITARARFSDGAWWRVLAARAAMSGARRKLQTDQPEGDEATRADVRAFVREVATLEPYEQRARLASEGYITPSWPRPWGRDATSRELLVIEEEFRAGNVKRPNIGIGSWALPNLIVYGTPEQQERWIMPTLRGDIAWCQLFSEPGAGSDLASLQMKATKVEGGWILNGQKVWTSGAKEADWGICLARTDPEKPKHDGISCFMVDMKSTGIDIRPLRELTGMAMFNEVFFDDVFVPEDCLVGKENDGWRCARTTLANERVYMGSSNTIGGGVVGVLQLLESRDLTEDEHALVEAGDLVVTAHALSVLGFRMTLQALAGADPSGSEAAVRKLLGVQHDQHVQEVGMTLVAADGAVMEGEGGPWVSSFLFNRCLTIAGGTSDIQRNVIAERLLGLPRDP